MTRNKVWTNRSAQRGLKNRMRPAGFRKEERMLSSGTLRRARLCPARSVLRWGAEKESLGSLTVSVQQDIKSGPPFRLRIYAEYCHIVRKFLPQQCCLRGSNTTQVVHDNEFGMAAPKPFYRHHQPTANKPRRNVALWIYGPFRPIVPPFTHLPVQNATQKGSNHCVDGVLKIGNQLNGQQRKSAPFLSTQKPSDGDFFFPELRK